MIITSLGGFYTTAGGDGGDRWSPFGSWGSDEGHTNRIMEANTVTSTTTTATTTTTTTSTTTTTTIFQRETTKSGRKVYEVEAQSRTYTRDEVRTAHVMERYYYYYYYCGAHEQSVPCHYAHNSITITTMTTITNTTT